MGFAEFLGVIVNMKDMQSMSDDHVDRWLRRDREHRCFRQAIFRTTPMQAASSMTDRLRSYQAKYPGQTGDHLRELAEELLGRLAAAQTKRS
jgi:chromosome partitioning protein